MDPESLVKDYINNLKIGLPRTKKLFSVAMMGLPGSGKSTIAKTIANRLKIPIASNDEIKGFLRLRGLNKTRIEAVVEKIIKARREFFFKKGISFVMDSDTLPHWKKVTEQCSKFGTKPLFVKVECSEKEILSRLTKRKKAENEYNAGVEDYVKRKKLWEGIEQPDKVDFVFNSEKNLDKQINLFLRLIDNEGLV